MGRLTRRAFPWLVLAGILVAALSLRGPIIALTPVLPDIIVDLGISSASAGLLTTAPVLMFAALTPFAALLIRRAGPELALLLSLSGVLIGTFVRALPGFGAMLTGMLIMGAAITIGNVVIPVIIRRDLPPERTAIATAAYTATMNVGSLTTALGTVPLAAITGWSLALLLWGVFTVVGIGLWIVHMVRSRSESTTERLSGEPARAEPGESASAEAITGPMPVVIDSRIAATLRRPIVWLLLAAFASQSAIYYAMSTWLPTILIETTDTDAATAGALASLFQGVAIAGAMLAPALLKYVGAVPAAVLMGACFGTMVLGMLLAPELAGVWASFGAIAHSSGFVLIFTGLVRVSRTNGEAATMSAFVQGGGYLFAAFGAPLMGALHESSGDWRLPLLGVLAVTIVYTTALIAAMLVAFRRA
ncbi:MFS transporter [Microbacterium sp. A84]|uniref:MFS transporter n=1 Tax=Microbacterium sp. A84 TaxID=3450715 RepID=UPI003F42415C